MPREASAASTWAWAAASDGRRSRACASRVSIGGGSPPGTPGGLQRRGGHHLDGLVAGPAEDQGQVGPGLDQPGPGLLHGDPVVAQVDAGGEGVELLGAAGGVEGVGPLHQLAAALRRLLQHLQRPLRLEQLVEAAGHVEGHRQPRLVVGAGGGPGRGLGGGAPLEGRQVEDGLRQAEAEGVGAVVGGAGRRDDEAGGGVDPGDRAGAEELAAAAGVEVEPRQHALARAPSWSAPARSASALAMTRSWLWREASARASSSVSGAAAAPSGAARARASRVGSWSWSSGAPDVAAGGGQRGGRGDAQEADEGQPEHDRSPRRRGGVRRRRGAPCPWPPAPATRRRRGRRRRRPPAPPARPGRAGRRPGSTAAGACSASGSTGAFMKMAGQHEERRQQRRQEAVGGHRQRPLERGRGARPP